MDLDKFVKDEKGFYRTDLGNFKRVQVFVDKWSQEKFDNRITFLNNAISKHENVINTYKDACEATTKEISSQVKQTIKDIKEQFNLSKEIQEEFLKNIKPEFDLLDKDSKIYDYLKDTIVEYETWLSKYEEIQKEKIKEVETKYHKQKENKLATIKNVCEHSKEQLEQEKQELKLYKNFY